MPSLEQAAMPTRPTRAGQRQSQALPWPCTQRQILQVSLGLNTGKGLWLEEREEQELETTG